MSSEQAQKILTEEEQKGNPLPTESLNDNDTSANNPQQQQGQEEEGMGSRRVSITPSANPFSPPTSHNGCFSILKMIFIGLILFIPRVIFTVLLVLSMWVWSLFTCYCCCDGPVTDEGGYPVEPSPRPFFRFMMRFHVRLLLLVWGYYWISVTRCENREKTPKGQPNPGIVVCNHTSFVEPFIIFYLEGVTALGKGEALTAPVIGRIVSALQFLAVNRTDPNNRHHVASEICRRAQSGGAWPPLLIFPEGTCTNRSAIIQFKNGAFNPLVPVRAMAIDFPNWWCDPAWVGPITVGGVFCRLLCQVFNRAHVTYLGDVSPPANAEEAKQYYNPENEIFPISPTSPSPESNDPAAAASTSSADSKHNMVEAFAEKVRRVYSEKLHTPLTEHSFDDVRLDYSALVLFPNSSISLPGRIQLSKHNLRYKKARELLNEFAKYNTSRSGRLSKKEFRKFLGLEHQPDIADEIFKQWKAEEKDAKELASSTGSGNKSTTTTDNDDDDGIDFRNFIRQASVMKMKQIRSQVAVAVQEGADMESARSNSNELLSDVFSGCFLSFDSDKDGVVNKEEFRRGMRVVAPTLDDEKLDVLFDEVDKGKDGTIQLEEFVEYCEKNPHFMNYVIDVISRSGMDAIL